MQIERIPEIPPQLPEGTKREPASHEHVIGSHELLDDPRSGVKSMKNSHIIPHVFSREVPIGKIVPGSSVLGNRGT